MKKYNSVIMTVAVLLCWTAAGVATLAQHEGRAYLQNMATLTRLLRDQVQQCGSVNGDVARDLTAEIWRSFDQSEC